MAVYILYVHTTYTGTRTPTHTDINIRNIEKKQDTHTNAACNEHTWSNLWCMQMIVILESMHDMRWVMLGRREGGRFTGLTSTPAAPELHGQAQSLAGLREKLLRKPNTH